MKRKITVLLLLLCTFLTLSTVAQTSATAKVTGQVMDAQGHYLISTILVRDTVAGTRQTLFTDLSGRFELDIPKGNYLLTVLRGSSYEKLEIELAITSRIPKPLGIIELKKLYDIRSQGWYAGDLHQHTLFSDGKDTPLELLFANVAMGCDFGFITDHNTVDGVREYLSFPEIDNGPAPFLALGGVEVTSVDKGHFNVLNTNKTYYYAFASADEFAASVASAESGDTFVQINHPSRRDVLGFAYWELIDRFDGIEVWNGKDLPPMHATNLNAKEEWYRLLNTGLRLTATASSDVHSISGSALSPDLEPLMLAWYERGTFAAMPCTYVKTDVLSAPSLIAALKNGCAFMSNGPLVLADIDGLTYGEAVAPGDHVLNYSVMNNEPLAAIRFIKNGEVVEEVTALELSAEGSINIKLSEGDYLVIEVEGANLGYALTNPIYCKL